jgi:soluble lytic murein transglycosylase-like protein
MTSLLLLFAAALALSASAKGSSPVRDTPVPPPSPDFVRVRRMIRDEAVRQGVPTEIALATARVESNFDPTREGDLQWHTRAARFDANVPRDNPFRSQPELWHSYGLFQLLAPYHVLPGEDPRALLNPQINTERGVRTLKRLLLKYNGDPDTVRLRYTGAWRSDAATQAKVLAKWRKALDTERALKG